MSIWERAQRLQSHLGVTEAQIARACGLTSVRQLRMSSIPKINEEFLRSFEALAFGLQEETPRLRLAKLLDSSAGPSLFRRHLERIPQAQRLHWGVPMEELLGLAD